MQSSYDAVWDSNTFHVTGWNFGSEFTAHEKVTNNHIWISGSEAAPGLVIGGLDVDFSGNDVHGGSTNRAGLPVMITDFYAGSPIYAEYSQDLRIDNNQFECTSPTLKYCLYLRIPGTEVSGNRVTVVGNTNGILIGRAPNAADNDVNVAGNTIAAEEGAGIVVNPSPHHSAIIQNNIINARGMACIRIGMAYGEQGVDTISGNQSTGCRFAVRTETFTASQ